MYKITITDPITVPGDSHQLLSTAQYAWEKYINQDPRAVVQLERS